MKICKLNHDNCVKSIITWLKSLYERISAEDCRVQKLINVISLYHAIMRQGPDLQELEFCLLFNYLPKFSIFTTYKPGITNLRSVDMNLDYLDDSCDCQKVIELLSVVPKFCNGIIHCELWMQRNHC
jgi:hypothetical protein